jgi:hypothetical protein
MIMGKGDSQAESIRDRIKELRRVRASELQEHPQNWRKHPAAQRNALAKLLGEIGFADAVLAYEPREGGPLTLIDGHLRRGLSKDAMIPVLVLDVNEMEAKKLLASVDIIASMAEANHEQLAALRQELGDREAQLRGQVETGMAQARAALEAQSEQMFERPSSLGDDGTARASDPFGSAADVLPRSVFQLDNNPIFPAINEYGYPGISAERCAREIPKPIKTWAGRNIMKDDGESHYLWIYGAMSTTDLDTRRAIMAFWTHDDLFEAIWTDTASIVAKAMNAGVKYAVMPDFSLWEDDPTIQQMYNHYRNVYLARYFQEAGLTVIPKMRQSARPKNAPHDFHLWGLPKGVAYAVALQTNMDETMSAAWQRSFIEQLNFLQPTELLVYASSKIWDVALRAFGGIVPMVHVDNIAGELTRARKQRREVTNRSIVV